MREEAAEEDLITEEETLLGHSLPSTTFTVVEASGGAVVDEGKGRGRTSVETHPRLPHLERRLSLLRQTFSKVYCS